MGRRPRRARWHCGAASLVSGTGASVHLQGAARSTVEHVHRKVRRLCRHQEVGVVAVHKLVSRSRKRQPTPRLTCARLRLERVDGFAVPLLRRIGLLRWRGCKNAPKLFQCPRAARIVAGLRMNLQSTSSVSAAAPVRGVQLRLESGSRARAHLSCAIRFTQERPAMRLRGVVLFLLKIQER